MFLSGSQHCERKTQVKLTAKVEHVGEKTLALRESELLVGRAIDCRIRINSSQVSRHHCRIWWDDRGWHVDDLRSRNGTWVNDFKIDIPVLLKSGDRLCVGEYELMVSESEITPNGECESRDLETLPCATQRESATFLVAPALTESFNGNRTLQHPKSVSKVERLGWWRKSACKASQNAVGKLPVELITRFSNPAAAAREALSRRFDLGS